MERNNPRLLSLLFSIGFTNIGVDARTDHADYCTQHYWYELHAKWSGGDKADKAKIQICAYFEKWRGTAPTQPCAAP
jgi:hypothetical protein